MLEAQKSGEQGTGPAIQDRVVVSNWRLGTHLPPTASLAMTGYRMSDLHEYRIRSIVLTDAESVPR